MRLVLDTNIIVAAMRSRTGASAELLRLARPGRIQLVASTALCIEYAAVCLRDEHRIAAEFSKADVEIFLDSVVYMAEPVVSWFTWRPQLRDPCDEMVLEAAANGRAMIVTFNLRDFRPANTQFGIALLTPRDVLARMSK